MAIWKITHWCVKMLKKTVPNPTIQFKIINVNREWLQCTIVSSLSSSKIFVWLHVHIKQSLPFPLYSHPWQPWICFLSLWICLFWTLHINQITQHVTFCVWLLLHNIMFLRFIHVVVCYQYIPFLWPNNIPNNYIIISYFVYPFISWWTFGLSSLFGCCE